MFFNSISISKPPKNPLTIQKITKTQKKPTLKSQNSAQPKVEQLRFVQILPSAADQPSVDQILFSATDSDEFYSTFS